MGIYSTEEMSRSEAIDHIESELEDLDLRSLTNDRLAEILFLLIGDRWGANFMISGEERIEDIK